MISTVAVGRIRAVPGNTAAERLAPLGSMGFLIHMQFTTQGRGAAILCDVRVAATNKPCFAHASFYDAITKQNQCGRHKSRNAQPGTGPSWSDAPAQPEIAVDNGSFDVPRATMRDEDGFVREIAIGDMSEATVREALGAISVMKARIEREFYTFEYALRDRLLALETTPTTVAA